MVKSDGVLPPPGQESQSWQQQSTSLSAAASVRTTTRWCLISIRRSWKVLERLVDTAWRAPRRTAC